MELIVVVCVRSESFPILDTQKVPIIVNQINLKPFSPFIIKQMLKYFIIEKLMLKCPIFPIIQLQKKKIQIQYNRYVCIRDNLRHLKLYPI